MYSPLIPNYFQSTSTLQPEPAFFKQPESLSETPLSASASSPLSFMNAFIGALQSSYNSTSDLASSLTSSTGEIGTGRSRESNRLGKTQRGSKTAKNTPKKVVKPHRQRDLSSMVDDDINFAKQIVELTKENSVNWKKIAKLQKSSVPACKDRWNRIKKRQMQFLSNMEAWLAQTPETAPTESQEIDVFEVLDNLVQEFKTRGQDSSAIILPDPACSSGLAQTYSDPSYALSFSGPSAPSFRESMMHLESEENIEDIDKFLS